MKKLICVISAWSLTFPLWYLWNVNTLYSGLICSLLTLSIIDIFEWLFD